jgi:hypothetical protein
MGEVAEAAEAAEADEDPDVRVGSAPLEADGSYLISLNALPLNGQLVFRPSGVDQDSHLNLMLDEATWRQRTVDLAARFGLAEPGREYVGFEARCWKCGKPAPVFLWPGIKDWVVPPEPAPRTVKPRFSKTINKTYPANGCVECDAMFGDFFLFDLILDFVDYDDGAELVDRFFNDLEPPGETTS